jgi:hypothetical protein
MAERESSGALTVCSDIPRIAPVPPHVFAPGLLDLGSPPQVDLRVCCSQAGRLSEGDRHELLEAGRLVAVVCSIVTTGGTPCLADSASLPIAA